MPPGKYIFNNVNFSVNDPMVEKLRTAGYRVFPNPVDDQNILVTLPVAWHGMRFEKDEKGIFRNNDTATDQLERYKMLMGSYVEQNCSVSISYRADEVGDIVDWLFNNWNSYVGVSFLPVGDADEAGYAYLPQEVVSEEEYTEYVNQLQPVNLEQVSGIHELEDDECVSGVCPTK